MTTTRAIRTPKKLLDQGLISEEILPDIEKVTQKYAVSITPAMLGRINDADDPVGRQFVPSPLELETTPAEREDPIGDDPYTPVKGITHRYPDRVLLKPLHVCPVYCRFCFRREVVGPGDAMLKNEQLEAALDYIRSHPEIWEVIFTGGDPFIIAPVKLRPMLEALDQIEHVRVVRFHTRIPVVDPGRVTDDLVGALTMKTPVWVVVHTNHAQEIGPESQQALARLAGNGIPLVSQTVLLRGVNDSPEALEQLFRTLIVNRVKPYYLHHGDMAMGTGHFRTTIDEGQHLMRRLRGRVSGMCQPTYVLDIPGGYGKVPIGPGYLNAGHTEVTDPWGQQHAYPPVRAED